MLRRAPILSFVLAQALIPACGSDGSNDARNGGAGGQGANGGVVASGGSGVGNGGRLAAGGSQSVGTGGGAAGGRSSTGGVISGGGSDGKGSGGKASTGGVTSGGVSASGAAGRSSTGGASASGGRGSGGAAGSGGAQNTGGATAGTTGNGGKFSSAKCPDTTWKQVWGDDFDGASGSAIDSSKWAYDSGPNWYNGELQAYTTGTTNASLDGNGNLVIEARKENREGRQYTSARIKTEGKKTFTYGRFEGRMKLPYGQGLWPAFWMLGGTSWPNDGEIDIMENLGREPSISHGTIHGPGYSAAAGPSASYTLPGGAVFSDDFHVFAIEWEVNEIRWYVDGNHFSTKTPADISGKTWVFNHGFFFILNVAVGGEWPGDPDETTVFPQRMLVDYVRVCQK